MQLTSSVEVRQSIILAVPKSPCSLHLWSLRSVRQVGPGEKGEKSGQTSDLSNFEFEKKGFQLDNS